MERLNKSRIAAFMNASFVGTFGYRSATTPYTIHATMVFVGLEADVVVDGVRGRVLIVPPDTLHSECSPGALVGYAFDPERCSRITGFARAGGTRALDVRYAGAVFANRATLARPDVLAGVGSELERLLALGEPQRLDRRIARLLDELRDPATDRLAAVARTHLSSAHVQALFARDVGVPMRTYGLWRRLRYAVRYAVANTGLLDFTTAAHAAGFADLAHFSRTHRRMLGLAPSEIRKTLVFG